jgi:hypothetical protein
MEELHKLTHNMKIMVEINRIEAHPDGVNPSNGETLPAGEGNKHTLHLYLNDESIARCSFFTKKDENPDTVQKLTNKYLKILCKTFTKPLSKLLDELKSGVGFEVGATLKIG